MELKFSVREISYKPELDSRLAARRAEDKATGGLTLRESAQCPDEDEKDPTQEPRPQPRPQPGPRLTSRARKADDHCPAGEARHLREERPATRRQNRVIAWHVAWHFFRARFSKKEITKQVCSSR